MGGVKGWDHGDGADGARTGAESTNPIDPRLRARRAEVRRSKVRRRRRLVVAVPVLLSVATGAWFLAYRSPVLDVDHVTVRGNQVLSPVEIRRAAAVPQGGALVSVDLAAVVERVEARPWVLTATAARRWPGTVQVTVVERAPVAVMGTRPVLVDQEGRVLGVAPSGTRLPTIVGDPQRPGRSVSGASRRLAQVLGQIPPDLRGQVTRAASSGADLTLTLTDGVKVRWGDDQANAEKARSLMLLLDQADRPTIATVDVSVPSAAALTRQDGPVA